MFRLALHLGCFLALTLPAYAAKLKIYCAVGFRPAMEMVRTDYEKQTGHRIIVSYPGIPAFLKAAKSGETFDFAIYDPPTLKMLIEADRLEASTVDVARSGIGIGVKAGAAKPSVATVEQVTATLLAAGSIAYNDQGPAGIFFVRLLDRLGLTASVGPKLKPMAAGLPVPAVAKGEADIVVVVTPAILENAGVQLAGELPEQIQSYTLSTLGIAKNTKQHSQVQDFLRYLGTPHVAAIMKSKGMAPMIRP